MKRKEGFRMKKKTKQLIISALIACILVVMMPLSAYASNTSVSGGKTIEPNQNIEITATFTPKSGLIAGVDANIFL